MEQEINQKKKSVLRNKNFLLLFQGTLVSNIAAVFYSFALSFYILKATNNNTVLQGIYLAVCGVVFVLASLVGGILADRWNKVKIIYGSDFLKGFVLLFATIFIYLGVKNNDVPLQLVVLFVVGIINNLIAAVFSPASMALFPEIVDENQLQQANSYFNILTSFQSIFGIVLAGILYATVSISTLFIIVGAGYVLSGISELFIKNNHVPKENKLTIKIMFADFKEGLGYLKTMKSIMVLCVGILFVNFFFNPFFSNGQPYLITAYIDKANYMFKDWMPSEMWSSVFTISFSIGSLVMSMLLGSMAQKTKYGKWIKNSLLALGLFLLVSTIVFYIFIRISDNINIFLISYAILMLLVGVTVVSVNIPTMTVIQKISSKDKIAKIMSLINIGSQGLIPIASFLSGILIRYFGLGIFFAFCSIGMLLVAIIIYFIKPINEI